MGIEPRSTLHDWGHGSGYHEAVETVCRVSAGWTRRLVL